uniref:Lipocalin n=1 Tax=Rhipicephalus appendiculatus TaxID=34631 RepID=A0A131Z5S5_RHIAP
MMLTQAIGLFLVFATYVAHAEESSDSAGKKPLPEENPIYFPEQHISDVAEVNETWVVTRRNVPPTGYNCHSATKVSGEGDTYTYLFSVRNETTKQYIKWNVTMTAVTTGNHTVPNAVQYTYLNRNILFFSTNFLIMESCMIYSAG